jgi:hypothetical protein
MGFSRLRKKMQKDFERMAKPKKSQVEKPVCPVHGSPYTEEHSKDSPSAGGWKHYFCKKCRAGKGRKCRPGGRGEALEII